MYITYTFPIKRVVDFSWIKACMSVCFREAIKMNTVLSTAGCDVILHVLMEKSEAVML